MRDRFIHRNAVAALVGLTAGFSTILLNPNSANTADLGGDCCADLEERVAELEAMSARKGNKKVTVTISGWVIKAANWWDDGVEENVVAGDKGFPIASNFVISGTAQITDEWSSGYALHVETPGSVFSFASNQNQDATQFGAANTLLSYMWVRSENWGTLNWGQLYPATDNVALLPDLSGTVLESNAVLQEGAGFFLRPKGVSKAKSAVVALNWGNFLWCEGLNAGIGGDCGVPTSGVRYDSPTFAGFSLSGGYGTLVTGANNFDLWDVALRYADESGDFKTSAAYGYTHTTGGSGLATSAAPGF